MDNNDKINTLNRDTINIHENYEVEYWSRELGIRPERLREIVKSEGDNVSAVKEYLNK